MIIFKELLSILTAKAVLGVLQQTDPKTGKTLLETARGFSRMGLGMTESVIKLRDAMAKIVPGACAQLFVDLLDLVFHQGSGRGVPLVGRESAAADQGHDHFQAAGRVAHFNVTANSARHARKESSKVSLSA